MKIPSLVHKLLFELFLIKNVVNNFLYRYFEQKVEKIWLSVNTPKTR